MDAAERELHAAVSALPGREGRSGRRGICSQRCDEGEGFSSMN